MYLSKRQIRRYNTRVSTFAIIIIVLHHIVPFIVVIIVRRLPSLDLHTKKNKKIFKKKSIPSLYRMASGRKAKVNSILSFGSPNDERTMRGHSAFRSLGFAPLAPNENASCAFGLSYIVSHVNIALHGVAAQTICGGRVFEQPMKGDRAGWRACPGQS